MRVARPALVCLNCGTLFLGLFLLASCIYVASVFSQGWSALVSLDDVWLGIAASVAMLIVSGIGAAAAEQNNHKLLWCYLFMQLLITAMLIGACSLIFAAYHGYITEATLPVSSITTTAAIDLNNFLLSTYTACCAGCHYHCNNAQTAYNYTTPTPCANATCFPVTPCGDSAQIINTYLSGNTSVTPSELVSEFGTAACYIYANATNSTVELNPPYAPNGDICTALTMVNGANGAPLVGTVSNGKSCGGGNPSVYRDQVNGYFSSRYYYLSIALACVCAFQITVAFLTYYVLMSDPERYKKNDG